VGYGQVVRRLWRIAREYGFDGLITLGAIGGALEVALRHGADQGPRTTLWLAAPATSAVVLPLLARRRFPFAAPASVWLLAAALSFIDGRLVVSTASVYIAGTFASLLLGNQRDVLQARLGLAIALGGAIIVVYNDPLHTVGEFISVPILFGIVWVAGYALRARATQAEAADARAGRLEDERERGAHMAVADERARLARELHDVVGHSVSVMTVQASAVRRLLKPEQKREREALLTVERTGREALTEMRRLVGVLRDPDEAPSLAPQPSLSHIENLVEHARETGLPTDVLIEGDRIQLPGSIDLTAYRLVQEGLTNTIKHAEAHRAEVRVRYTRDHVEVEVCDDGRGIRGASNHDGHGLVGMRERISLYGGELEAGPRAKGGYRLWARLPVKT
jgi:signal transduction histidine kinase